MSGYRIGVIHSWSPLTLDSIRSLCYYSSVPAVVQRKMTTLISDSGTIQDLTEPEVGDQMIRHTM